MKQPVPHEITLAAFGRDAENGCLFLIDLVPTSNRNASFFARKWMRDPQVIAIDTARPDGRSPVHHKDWHRHTIRRPSQEAGR